MEAAVLCADWHWRASKSAWRSKPDPAVIHNPRSKVLPGQGWRHFLPLRISCDLRCYSIRHLLPTLKGPFPMHNGLITYGITRGCLINFARLV